MHVHAKHYPELIFQTTNTSPKEALAKDFLSTLKTLEISHKRLALYYHCMDLN